jgi:transcriptional regulator with XRE-family HTH domain
MGQRFRELRHRRGLSQEGLARIVGVGRDAVRLWEKGERTPGLNTAARLAGALGVTVGVLAGTEPMPPAPRARKKGGK